MQRDLGLGGAVLDPRPELVKLQQCLRAGCDFIAVPLPRLVIVKPVQANCETDKEKRIAGRSFVESAVLPFFFIYDISRKLRLNDELPPTEFPMALALSCGVAPSLQLTKLS